MGIVVYIQATRKRKQEKQKIKMRIELNTMVTLTIASQVWIGQVVEIIDEVVLVRLAENMHYHAKMNELTLFTKCTESKNNT
tara:strand:- start:1164 stop:1409 length:246 start_codon:yes stop_codon:yes gene_type:complete